MSSDLSATNDYVSETAAGQSAIVAALVIALNETGVLPMDKYADVLNRLWIRLPDEEAEGEAGAVIARVLDLLGTLAGSALPSGEAARGQPASTAPGRPVNDDFAACPDKGLGPAGLERRNQA